MPAGPDNLPDDDGTPLAQTISTCAVTLISEAEKHIRSRNQKCDNKVTPFLTSATMEISAAEDEKAACIDRLRKALEGFQFDPATISAIENRLSLITSKSITISQIISNLASSPPPANPLAGPLETISITSSPLVRQASPEYNPPSCIDTSNTDPDNITAERLSGAGDHESDASRPVEVQRGPKASRPARKRKWRNISGAASQKTNNQRDNKRSRKTNDDSNAASPRVAQTEFGTDLDDTEFVSINTKKPDSPFVIRCKDLVCKQRKAIAPPFQRNQALNHFNKKHRGPDEEYYTEEYIWENFSVKILDVDENWVRQRAKGRPHMCTPKNFAPVSLKKGYSEPSRHEQQTQDAIEYRTVISPNTITCASDLPSTEQGDTNMTAPPTPAAQTNHSPGPSLYPPQTARVDEPSPVSVTNEGILYRTNNDDAEASFGPEMGDDSNASDASYEGSWAHGLPDENDGTEQRDNDEAELRDNDEVELRPFGYEGQWPRRYAPKEPRVLV